jgi:multiple sugar transport system substrate-binding protein
MWQRLALFLAVVMMIAGCGNSTAPASQGNNQAAAPTGETKAAVPTAAPASGEAVTLRWYLRWDKARIEKVAQPVVAAFEKEHPNIKIEIENIGTMDEYWTKLQTMIASNNAPDVIYPATHQTYALASKGALLNLESYISADKLDVSKYDTKIVDLYRYDGNLYGLPVDMASLGVFYNKAMFDAAGLPYPQAGWTWDDFRKTALALTKDTNGDGKTDQFGVDNFNEYWPIVVWTQAGHGVFNDIRKPSEFKLGDEKSVAALQWLADLSTKDHAMPTITERGDISDMFVAGKSGMKIIGHWRVPQYMANIKDFTWDIAPLPRGVISANRADGSAFAITAQSKHPRESWEFVKFLAGPGSYGVNLLLDLQQMTPALLEFQQSDKFLKPESLPGVNKQALVAEQENLFTMYDPIHPSYDELNSIIRTELTELWDGKATAQEAVGRMQPQMTSVLETVK